MNRGHRWMPVTQAQMNSASNELRSVLLAFHNEFVEFVENDNDEYKRLDFFFTDLFERIDRLEQEQGQPLTTGQSLDRDNQMIAVAIADLADEVRSLKTRMDTVENLSGINRISTSPTLDEFNQPQKQISMRASDAVRQVTRTDADTKNADTDSGRTDEHSLVVKILYLKRQNPDMSVREIATHVGIGKTKVAEIIQRLKQEGHLS